MKERDVISMTSLKPLALVVNLVVSFSTLCLQEFASKDGTSTVKTLRSTCISVTRCNITAEMCGYQCYLEPFHQCQD